MLQFDESVLLEGNVLNLEDKEILLKGYVIQDEKLDLWDIADDKAPGIDGFSAAFFKQSWSIIGEDITQAALNFFTSGKIKENKRYCNTLNP